MLNPDLSEQRNQPEPMDVPTTEPISTQVSEPPEQKLTRADVSTGSSGGSPNIPNQEPAFRSNESTSPKAGSI